MEQSNDKYAYALIEFEYEEEDFVSAVPISWIDFNSMKYKFGNFKIGNLKVMEIMKATVRWNYPNSSDKTFEESVMAWLKQFRMCLDIHR
ncbi:hypothetical protein RN001_006805 [Aquatica leii]|uniref:Uncharacterized protein n=1 Tax=Aquatica leii TaxID=1421715 RepID=A0AAN7SBN4_9COLE|nr:hypothetical protein RN001_006805 [Aquatica leii]